MTQMDLGTCCSYPFVVEVNKTGSNRSGGGASLRRLDSIVQ
jgi:hypothetical protein